MNAGNITKLGLLAASKLGSRLFRQNTGTGWIGKHVKGPGTVTLGPHDVVIRNARPFHSGFEGWSDTGGFTPRDGVAVYTQIEVKTDTDRVRPTQRQWIDVVRSAGGLAGIARSAADFEAIIRGETRD